MALLVLYSCLWILRWVITVEGYSGHYPFDFVEMGGQFAATGLEIGVLTSS